MKQWAFESIVEAFFLYQSIARQILFEDRCGLTKLQAAALGALLYAGSMNMTELARCLAVSKEQATRTVAPLVDAGLVVRGKDDGNRRRVIVSLTAEGTEFLAQQWDTSRRLLEERLAGLDDEELARLATASDTVAGLLRKALGNEGAIGPGALKGRDGADGAAEEIGGSGEAGGAGATG